MAQIALPEPPTLYPQPDRQRLFSEQFQGYFGLFEPPRQNSAIILTLRNGDVIMGNLFGLTPSNLVVNTTARQLVTIPRTDLSEQSERQVYREAFAASLARTAIDENLPQPPLDTLLAPRAQNPEPRTMLFEQGILRAGPGFHFRPIEETPLLRGARIFALDERDGWILAAMTPNATRGLGWIQKPLSFPADQRDGAILTREIENLLNTGFISGVDHERNLAQVNLFRWRIASPEIQEGSSRLLAFYIGHKRGSGRNWVDIVDDQNGQRLANYSESRGFRTF